MPARPLQLLTTRLDWLSRRISLAGFHARKQALEIIENGQVEVDGQVVKNDVKLGSHHKVKCEGKDVPWLNNPLLWVVRKPRGCNALADRSDPNSLGTVSDAWLEERKENEGFKHDPILSLPNHFVCVRPLQSAISGIQLCTSDGEFAANMSAADSCLMSTYHIRVEKTN